MHTSQKITQPHLAIPKSKSLFIALAIITVLGPLAYLYNKQHSQAKAAWFDESFAYRQAVPITNSGSYITDLQITFDLNTASLISANKMQSDCDDIRITNNKGETLPYWIEGGTCNTASTHIWIKNNISEGDSIFYIYYGNPSADNRSSGKDVFIFFEDFESYQPGDLPTNEKWLARSGNWTVSTSVKSSGNNGLIVSGTTGSDNMFWLNLNYQNTSGVLEGSVYSPSTISGGADSQRQGLCVGNTSTPSYGHCLLRGGGANSFQFLHSLMAWGPGTNETFLAASWYGFSLKFDASTLYGSTWQLGSAIPSPQLTWSRSTRSGDYFGLTSRSTANGFDDIRVRKYTTIEPTVGPSATEENSPAPIAYWKLDEESGDTVYDSTSTMVNGTLSGSTPPSRQSSQSCISEGCLSFNGTTSQININPSNRINPSDSITASTWVKITGAPGGGSWHSIMGRGGWGDSFWFQINNSGQVQINMEGVVHYSTFSTPVNTIQNNQWYHVAFTYDQNGGTDNANIYVNGSLVKTLTLTGAIGATSDYIRIGGANSYYLNGLLDELKIYNYARTSEQIKTEYAAGLGHENTNKGAVAVIGTNYNGSTNLTNRLLDYWKFDENSGATANNSMPNRNNINITGANWTQSGKLGKALYFNGTSSDYATVSVPEIIDSDSQSFTITTWIKSESSSSSEGMIAAKSGYHSGLVSSNGTVVSLQLWNTTPTRFTSSANINLNTWYHVAGVFDRSQNKMRLYLNGVLKDEDDFTGNIRDYSSTLRFGGNADASWNFKGYIDNLKIYNLPLTENEISIDMNNNSALNLGAVSTDISGNNVQSSDRAYCVPGDTNTCDPPVGEWKFDEFTGNSTADNSGNNNTGLIINSPPWISGKVGSAININGNSKKVTLTTPLGYSGYTTASVWYKRSESSASSSWRTILGHGSDNIHPLILNQTTRNLGIWDGSWRDFGYNVPDDDKWHHFEVVYNSGVNATLYVDGVYKNQITTTLNLFVNPIGTIGNWNGNNYWAGPIDHITIYNYARTPAQIAWDFNRGMPIIHWKLDECQGNTANDSSGNSLNASLSIGTGGSVTSLGTCNLSSSAWGNGKVGKLNSGFNLDGTDDYIYSNPNINFSGWRSLTASAWIYPNPSSSDRVIFGKFNEGDQGYGSSVFKIWMDSSDQIQFKLSTLSDWPNQIGSSPITENEWHLITGTWDGTNMYLFIDGVLVNQMAVNGYLTNPETLTIGRESYTSSNYFRGKIDDIHIYNYGLTYVQIRNLVNASASTRFAPLTGPP